MYFISTYLPIREQIMKKRLFFFMFIFLTLGCGGDFSEDFPSGPSSWSNPDDPSWEKGKKKTQTQMFM